MMQEERGITRRLEEGGEREEGRQADEKSGKEVDAGGRTAEEETKKAVRILRVIREREITMKRRRRRRRKMRFKPRK